MQILDSVAALEAVTEPSLRPILERYRDLMDLAVIFIVDAGDDLDTLQQARGWPFADWEFIHYHASGVYEAVSVYGQAGEGHVVLVRDDPAICDELRQACAAASEPAEN